jgi:hypothetical protein
MNPQFFLNLNDPDPYDDERNCPVVISLLQQQDKRKSEHAIGFKVGTFKADRSILVGCTYKLDHSIHLHLGLPKS